MPSMQQAGTTLPRLGATSRLQDYHPLMDSTQDENFPRPSDGESVSIADLLGLNMPRGSLVGGANGSHGQRAQTMSTTNPLFIGSPTRPYAGLGQLGDDSGYQTSHPGSPLPLDMSTQGKPAPFRMRGRLDSVGMYPPASPASPSSQGPFSPSNGFPTRPFRSGSLVLSDAGSSLDYAFMMNSRATSPESDSSLASLDNPNLSELMKCLNLDARSRSDSGQSTGLPSNVDQRQQELTNLTNLHVLQTLADNSNFYQHDQHFQSPLNSPVSSPVATPDMWSPGSRSNGSQSSVPSSPLCGPNPLRSFMPCMKALPTSGSGVVKIHRSLSSPDGATVCKWKGELPPRTLDKNVSLSVKVFLGGTPWDINDIMLTYGFKHIGPIRVEWPTSKQPGVPPPKGYAYIIFENEKQVKALLQACTYEYSGKEGHWYFKVSSKRMKSKVVQVIPWTSSDTNWVCNPSQKLDPEKTVFVGGLHGMLNAHGLAVIMNDLFGGVVYAGIDTDKFKYPIGSARVTFNNNRSFFRAINARFIFIEADKFSKKVQVLPYLEDSPCSVCLVQHGPYFCQDVKCFRYYCHSCWQWMHSQESSLTTHDYLTRSSKYAAIAGVGMAMSMSHGTRAQGRRELTYM